MGSCPCHCPCHCDAILIDEDDLFEFRNIPYNSWIPSSVLALAAISLGAVLIHLTSAQLWFVSLVLWILAGVMLAKVKYERYTFNKIFGTVMITRRGITGTRVKTYSLTNIKEIIYEKERDMQGGDDVQLFMHLENGKEVKLLAGHFCGIRAKLKKLLKKKLDFFLKNISRLSHQGHKEKKDVKVKIKPHPKVQTDSSVVSSSSGSSEYSSYVTDSYSSEPDKNRIRRQEPPHSPDSNEDRKKRRRRSKGKHKGESFKQGVKAGGNLNIEEHANGPAVVSSIPLMPNTNRSESETEPTTPIVAEQAGATGNPDEVVVSLSDDNDSVF